MISNISPLSFYFSLLFISVHQPLIIYYFFIILSSFLILISISPFVLTWFFPLPIFSKIIELDFSNLQFMEYSSSSSTIKPSFTHLSYLLYYSYLVIISPSYLLFIVISLSIQHIMLFAVLTLAASTFTFLIFILFFSFHLNIYEFSLIMLWLFRCLVNFLIVN